MPFSVNPSPKVVISVDNVTDDDFLKVILRNGEILYLRHDARQLFFVFDEEFRPQSLIAQTEETVNKLLAGLSLKIDGIPKPLKEQFNKRKGADKKLTLKVWLARRLQETVSCVWTERNNHISEDFLNIGRRLIAEVWWLSFDGEIIDTSSYRSLNTFWYSSERVAAILPITREEIRSELHLIAE